MSMPPNPQLFQEGASFALYPGGSVRLYKVWPGNNRFFFGGRLVFGPDAGALFLTLFLIVVPMVVFCVFVARHLMKEFRYHSGVAIIVVAVVHTIVVLVLLLLTAARDPGIIPRKAQPPEPEESTNATSDGNGGQKRQTKDVWIDGKMVKVPLNYCETCMLYRPPRCSHCRRCNNCIDRFDHHCPWVGQCVGRRNYPHFVWFLLTSTLLTFFVFAMCALRIKQLMDGDPPRTVWRALRTSPASVALMAYGFIVTWFIGGLTAFHLYLISKNRTTYENIRYRGRSNANDQGVLRNFQDVLCSSIPPSQVNFRAMVPVESHDFVNLNAQERGRDNMALPMT